MAQFSTEAELSIIVPDREVKEARKTIESGLSDVRVGVDASGGAASRMVRSDGGTASGMGGRRARRMFRWARERTESMQTMVDLLGDIKDGGGFGGEGGDGGGGFVGAIFGGGAAGGARSVLSGTSGSILGGLGGGALANKLGTVSLGSIITKAKNLGALLRGKATLSSLVSGARTVGAFIARKAALGSLISGVSTIGSWIGSAVSITSLVSSVANIGAFIGGSIALGDLLTSTLVPGQKPGDTTKDLLEIGKAGAHVATTGSLPDDVGLSQSEAQRQAMRNAGERAQPPGQTTVAPNVPERLQYDSTINVEGLDLPSIKDELRREREREFQDLKDQISSNLGTGRGPSG